MIEQDFKNSLLDVLSEFHDFCEMHQLRYYLIGGGLIGALRHKGFIPWDDDVDVAMPREDYERFLALRNELSEGYKVSIPFQKDGYTNTMPRVYSTNFKIQQQFIKRFTIGPWIDVFPLDHTFDNNFLRKLHFRLVYIFKVLNACKLGGVSVLEGRKKARFKLLFYYLLKPVPSLLLSKPFECLQTIKRKPSRYVGNLMGRWQEKEIIEKRELSETVALTFENISLKTFRNYNAWLHRVYGDYMQLPPVEQQVPDHYFDVVD
ncbi:MAG: LicD family protein [Methyloprofundus sp.]|nr:LicD family protein [Methyloprofundus sp.]